METCASTHREAVVGDDGDNGYGETPLSADERQFVTHKLPLVWCEARWVKRRCWHYVRVQVHELVGPGTIALARTLRAYDPKRNTSFEQYARARVRGSMFDAIRLDHLDLHARVEHAMLRESAAVAEHLVVDADLFGDPIEVLDRAMAAGCDEVVAAVIASGLFVAGAPCAEQDAVAFEEYRHAVEVFNDAVNALEPHLSDVFTRVHRDRQTLVQISVTLHLPYTTAKRLHGRALRQVRDAMTKGGVEHAPAFVDAGERAPCFTWTFGPDD